MQKVCRAIWPTGDGIARVKVFIVFVASVALERKHERVGGQGEVRKHTINYMMKNPSAARSTRVLAMLLTTAVTLMDPDKDEGVPV